MEILVLLGLILINGLFAMSEIAIVTAKRSRLSALAAKGKHAATSALVLAENPNQFLSTVQIGMLPVTCPSLVEKLILRKLPSRCIAVR